MAFSKSEFDALIQDCRDRAYRKDYFFWILLICIVAVALYLIGGLILSPSFVGLDNLGLILLWLVAFLGLVIYMKFSKSRARTRQELMRIDQIVRNRPVWGEEICSALLRRKVEIDMTPEMVLLAWGSPIKIKNADFTKTKVSEEKWDYTPLLSWHDEYVVFTNGKVSAIYSGL